MGVPMWLNLNADTTGISIAQQGGRAGSRLIEQGTPCRFHLFPLRVPPQGWGPIDAASNWFAHRASRAAHAEKRSANVDDVQWGRTAG
jgi:hypothetical protein